MARLALILARHIVYECILRDEYRGKVHRTIDTIRLHHVMIWKLMGSAVAVGILGISLLSEMQQADDLPGPHPGRPDDWYWFFFHRLVLARKRPKYLDALCGAIVGLLIDAGLYFEVYPHLLPGFLKMGTAAKLTLPHASDVGIWPMGLFLLMGVSLFLRPTSGPLTRSALPSWHLLRQSPTPVIPPTELPLTCGTA
jgi:hypothetical protein